MLHRDDEWAPEHMKKWRSRQGYATFLRLVQQHTDIEVNQENEICKQSYWGALLGGENMEEREVIENVKQAALHTANQLMLEWRKSNAFDKFIQEPQPSRQGDLSESNRPKRIEKDTRNTLLSGTTSFHNEYLQNIQKYRR